MALLYIYLDLKLVDFAWEAFTIKCKQPYHHPTADEIYNTNFITLCYKFIDIYDTFKFLEEFLNLYLKMSGLIGFPYSVSARVSKASDNLCAIFIFALQLRYIVTNMENT